MDQPLVFDGCHCLKNQVYEWDVGDVLEGEELDASLCDKVSQAAQHVLQNGFVYSLDDIANHSSVERVHLTGQHLGWYCTDHVAEEWEEDQKRIRYLTGFEQEKVQDVETFLKETVRLLAQGESYYLVDIRRQLVVYLLWEISQQDGPNCAQTVVAQVLLVPFFILLVVVVVRLFLTVSKEQVRQSPE